MNAELIANSETVVAALGDQGIWARDHSARVENGVATDQMVLFAVEHHGEHPQVVGKVVDADRMEMTEAC